MVKKYAVIKSNPYIVGGEKVTLVSPDDERAINTVALTWVGTIYGVPIFEFIPTDASQIPLESENLPTK